MPGHNEARFAMKHQLSQTQIDQYQSQGFLVIEGFLDSQELADWREQVDEAVHQRLTAPKTEGWDLTNQADPENYYARVFTQCIKLADTHQGVRRLIFDERIGQMAGELAGVDGIRVWHDQALIKPPYGNPTGWHLDNPYWSFSSLNSLSIWLALDDATLENGCLYYLPGTHSSGRTGSVGIGQNLGDLFRVYPDWLEIASVACPCPAGSAVFHNGLTAHGAGANMTNRPRRAMTCAFMPDGSTFNGQINVLPNEYAAGLQIGDLLNDEVVNPLIWSR